MFLSDTEELNSEKMTFLFISFLTTKYDSIQKVKEKKENQNPYQLNQEKTRFLQSQTCDITNENDKNTIIYGHW